MLVRCAHVACVYGGDLRITNGARAEPTPAAIEVGSAEDVNTADVLSGWLAGDEGRDASVPFEAAAVLQRQLVKFPIRQREHLALHGKHSKHGGFDASLGFGPMNSIFKSSPFGNPADLTSPSYFTTSVSESHKSAIFLILRTPEFELVLQQSARCRQEGESFSLYSQSTEESWLHATSAAPKVHCLCRDDLATSTRLEQYEVCCDLCEVAIPVRGGYWTCHSCDAKGSSFDLCEACAYHHRGVSAEIGVLTIFERCPSPDLYGGLDLAI